jgi:hypothetical protein
MLTKEQIDDIDGTTDFYRLHDEGIADLKRLALIGLTVCDRDIEADDCAIVAGTLAETAWEDGNYGRVTDMLRDLAAILAGVGS